MDINLTEMSGTEATKFIRNLEKQYGNIRTNIIAVSIDAKQQSDLSLFDHYSNFFPTLSLSCLPTRNGTVMERIEAC